MVNVFPLNFRGSILREITLDKVKQVIKTDGMNLMEAMNNTSSNDAAISLFKKLTTTPLPQPLDVSAEAEQAQAFLKEKFTNLLSTNPLKLGGMKIFSPSSWKGSVSNHQYIYDVDVSYLIKSDEFLNAISLMLPFEQWQQLKGLFTGNKSATLQLSRSLIDLMMSTSGQSLDPAQFINLINQHFATHFMGTEAAVESVVSQLTNMEQSIKQSAVTSLISEVIARLAVAARDKLIPLLATFIADIALHQQFFNQI
ncbi:MAG: hypothetical protein ACRCXC_13355 [Legionella sp.]